MRRRRMRDEKEEVIAPVFKSHNTTHPHAMAESTITHNPNYNTNFGCMH